MSTGGQVVATGNVSGGNVISGGLISAAGAVTAAGNITGGNITTAGLFSAGGNITGANIITGGAVSATGALTGGSLTVNGATVIAGNLTVSGNTFYTNVETIAVQDPIITMGGGANNTPLLSNDSKDRGIALDYYDTAARTAFVGYDNSMNKLIAATRVNITNEVITVSSYGTLVVGTLEGSNVSITGDVNAGNVVSAGFVQSATVSASGNVTGGNVITGGLITATGNIQGGNLRTSGLVSATGNVTGGNIITSGTVSTSSFSAGNTATVTSANYTIGYRDLPQLTSFGTLAATDGGKHYYGTGTITVPTNASVPLSVGTAVLIIATGTTTISAAGGVTLRWGGTSGTGSRTLAQYGVATLVKVATDTWYISGVGLS